MHVPPTRSARLAGLALTSAALAVSTVAAPSGAAVHTTTHAAAHAAARPAAPVIVAHMGNNDHIRLSRSSVHAGQVTFRVLSPVRTHELQIARLRHGYTLQQAGADIGKAFGGDVAAIRRVDHGVVFLGGAEARPHKPGMYTTALRRGHYLALDQDGNGLAFLTVHGTNVKRSAPRTSSRIGVFSYGFSMPHRISRTGWTKIDNVSDQPHFVEFQRIKESTTRAQIRAALQPQNENTPPPSFIRHGSTGTGVISNGHTIRFRYDLPPGKYLVACFWPDRDTGMPHAFMGMWTVVHLR